MSSRVPCRVALPIVGGPAPATYWPAIPLLAVLLAIPVLPFAAGASPVALALSEAAALVLLLWPAAAVAIRRLRDRHTAGWICLPFHAASIVVFMSAAFGKPVALGSSEVVQLVPLVMLLFLAAWLIVDSLTIADRSAPPNTEATVAA
jgi:uncharacterized membrane protein YhaH (DUF805 family)